MELLFLPFMLVLILLWSEVWAQYFWNGGLPQVERSISELIVGQIRVALGEEFFWRFLPFTAAYLILELAKRISINQKIVLTFLVLGIVCVQVLFGLAHTLTDTSLRAILELPPSPSFIEYATHGVLQGGVGIFLSSTYLYYLRKSKHLLRYFQLIPYLASCVLHTISNIIIVYQDMI